MVSKTDGLSADSADASSGDAPAIEFVLTLRKPLLAVDGSSATSIVLREPTVAELIVIADAPDGMSGIMAMNVATDSRYAAGISKMPARDFLAGMAYLNQFLEPAKFEGDVPDTYVVPLTRPLPTPDGTVSALKLREPTAYELIQIGKANGIKGDLAALATITGLDAETLQSIGAGAFMKAIAYIQAFFA